MRFLLELMIIRIDTLRLVQDLQYLTADMLLFLILELVVFIVLVVGKMIPSLLLMDYLHVF